MTKVKIRKIGNSMGIILPKDVLDLMKLSEGDEIEIDLEEGTLHIVLKNKKK